MTMAAGVSTLDERWQSIDLDEWTRRIVRRHFDPDTGSVYWLKRRPDLDFEPLDVQRYADLALFGRMEPEDLDGVDPVDLVPRGAPAGRVRNRVLRTGSIVGHDAGWRQRALRLAGFEPGRRWLYACPGGQPAALPGSVVHAIDLDWRWVARLIRDSRLAELNRYVDHVVDQIVAVLANGIDYLETTPALFAALSRRGARHVSRLAGVGLAGPHLDPALYGEFAATLAGRPLVTAYVTTFGAAMGLPARDDGAVLPYVPHYPQVTMSVVSRREPDREVGYGEVGRIRVTVLHEDLFLPNVLERDQAVRLERAPSWPCDGVANVVALRPLATRAQLGIY